MINQIVILGHTGFIGTNFELFFSEKHPEIKVVGKSLPAIDLTIDASSLKNYFDTNTAVIMCAAVKKQWGDSLENYQKNVAMIINLCKVLEEYPVQRLIYFSSASVYGENIPHRSITEETPIHPTSFYGIAKYASEGMLQKVMPKGLVIIRPPQIYGFGDQPCYGPSGFWHAALNNDPITLWGDGTEKREFIFVADIVTAVVKLIFSEYEGTLNVASGVSYSYRDILEKIKRLVSRPLNVKIQKRTQPKVDHHFNNQKFKMIFSAFQFTSLDDGLQKMIQTTTPTTTKTMTACCICTGPVLPQLDLGLQPVCNRFLSSPLDPEYKHPLKTGVCQQCGIMQLVDPFPAEELQPKVDWITYNEPEGHLDMLTEKLSKVLPAGGFVLGISFKDDSTLSRFEKNGFKTGRLDLSGDLNMVESGAGVESIQRQLTVSRAREIAQKYGQADALIVRHILEHGYDPPQFLAALKELIKPEGYMILEVPDCSRQLELLDYSTIWEEHTVYFTPETFKNCLLLHGFSIEMFDVVSSAIEGPMMAIVRLNTGKVSDGNGLAFSGVVAEEVKRVQIFCRSFLEFKKNLQAFFAGQSVSIFGAGHCATNLINLFELPVSRVIDDNPHKKGLFMPGSRVPIYGSDTLMPGEVCVLGVNPSAEARIVERYPHVKFRSFCPLGIYSLYKDVRPLKKSSEEVYYKVGSMVALDKAVMVQMKEKAMKNEQQKTRICAHSDITSSVHEMMIVHTQGTYVRPHKHIQKSESFHVIEGSAILVIFDEGGGVVQTIKLGDYASGKQFYYRLDDSYYHTLLITSPIIVFHETTKGPFDRLETVFPSWAPEGKDKPETEMFIKKLWQKIVTF